MRSLKLTEVRKSYGSKIVLDGISLDIKPSETIVLLGPSGCGKTTLLKLINRLIEADSGSIEIEGKSNQLYKKHLLRRAIGYVIQDVGLLPHLSIKNNIGLTSKIDGKTLSSEKLKELMELTGLDLSLLEKHPSELSGGQQQRVGIARALANDSELILMDEPFSALDNITRNQLQDDFINIPVLSGKTVILVTHDVQEAFKLGDRVVLLNEGKIQQVGTPTELLTSPANKFVIDFLSKDRLVLFLQNRKVDDQTAIEYINDSSIDEELKREKLAEILNSYHL